MYEIELYSTSAGNAPLKEFLLELKKQNRQRDLAQIRLYIEMLERYGFNINTLYHQESIKKLREDIYELRPGGNRVLFFFYDGKNKFVLLHGFKKKTNSAPKEIEKAIKEKKDYFRRI